MRKRGTLNTSEKSRKLEEVKQKIFQIFHLDSVLQPPAQVHKINAEPCLQKRCLYASLANVVNEMWEVLEHQLSRSPCYGVSSSLNVTHLRWWWLLTTQFSNHKVPAQLLAFWRTLVMQFPLHPKIYSFWYCLKETTELESYADYPASIPNYPITPSSGETRVSKAS